MNELHYCGWHRARDKRIGFRENYLPRAGQNETFRGSSLTSSGHIWPTHSIEYGWRNENLCRRGPYSISNPNLLFHEFRSFDRMNYNEIGEEKKKKETAIHFNANTIFSCHRSLFIMSPIFAAAPSILMNSASAGILLERIAKNKIESMRN